MYWLSGGPFCWALVTGSCSGAILCWTGGGSRWSSAAGGMRPRSIRLRIPFCASSSRIGGGRSCNEKGIGVYGRVQHTPRPNGLYSASTGTKTHSSTVSSSWREYMCKSATEFRMYMMLSLFNQYPLDSHYCWMVNTVITILQLPECALPKCHDLC